MFGSARINDIFFPQVMRGSSIIMLEALDRIA